MMVKIANTLGDVKTGKQGEAVYQGRYGQQIRRTLKPKRAIPSEKQLEHRQIYRQALSWRKSLSLANRRFLDGYCIGGWVIDSYGIPLPWSRFALKLYLEHVHFIPELTTETTPPSSGMGQFYNTGDGMAYNIFGLEWKAQSKTTDENPQTITHVKLKCYRAGSPGILTVSIRETDGEGKPTGADLCVGTINANDFTLDTSGLWYQINFDTPYDLQPNTKYAIVCRSQGTKYSICVKWRVDNTGEYEGGEQLNSIDGGVTWTATPANDFMFETYIEIPGTKYTTGTVTIRHPALKKVIRKTDGVPAQEWDNLSSLDDEWLTKHLVVKVEAGDTIEATTITGRQFTYQVP